jgi:hypothetical protein
MHVNFRNLSGALAARELIKPRADNAPNQQQFNARQRLTIYSLT